MSSNYLNKVHYTVVYKVFIVLSLCACGASENSELAASKAVPDHLVFQNYSAVTMLRVTPGQLKRGSFSFPLTTDRIRNTETNGGISLAISTAGRGSDSALN